MRAWRRSSGAGGVVADPPVVVEVLQFAEVLRVTFSRALFEEPLEPGWWVLTPPGDVETVVVGIPPTRLLVTIGPADFPTDVDYIGGADFEGSVRGADGVFVAPFSVTVPFQT